MGIFLQVLSVHAMKSPEQVKDIARALTPSKLANLAIVLLSSLTHVS